MNFYYIFSRDNDWIKLSGDGKSPAKCSNVKFTCNESNKDLKIIEDPISDYITAYGSILNYADHPGNLYILSNKFGYLLKFGYSHQKNNFIPFDHNKIITISKTEKIINVKGTAKRKAHKRVIITRDLDRLGDKEKVSKGIVTADYKESVKNMNNYISDLNQTDEGKKILKYIKGYTFGDYDAINEYMKSGNSKTFKECTTRRLLHREIPQTVKGVEKSISNIKKFIDDAPKFKGEVYRGLQYHTNDPESKKRWESFIKNIESLKEIKFGSFTSTSSEKMVGVNFATKQHFGSNMKSVLITIKTKSGVSIQNISQVESEHEVLLNNDKTYKIVSFEKQDNRNHFLELQEL